MKTKTILTTIAAIAFLVGCNQMENVSPLNDSESIVSSKWENAANSDNPYEDDSIGVIHNKGMEYLLSNSKGYSDKQFADSIKVMVKDFIISYNGDTPSQGQMSVVDSFISYYKNNDTIDENLFDPISHDHFNTTALEQIDTFNAILQDDYSNYSQLKSELIEWEKDVDSISDISGNQERALLNGGIVARYSSLFWNNYDSNNYKTNQIIGGPAGPDANGFINGFMLGIYLGYDLYESFILGALTGIACTALHEPEPPIV